MSASQIPERRQSRSLVTVLQDETGSFSAARVLLFTWLANAALYIWQHEPTTDDSIAVVLTFFTGIAVPLIMWAGGPRIAQYLAPAMSSIMQASADAAKSLAAKIQARRNPADGYEVSK